MSKSLIIVESPTKARTIERFLGREYEVLASYGHVRDLPEDASQIPEKVKKEPWARLGINVDKEFEPLYIVPSEKEKRVKDLKTAVRDATEILLATDEDREGESISWHLLQLLDADIRKRSLPVRRLVFHEITKTAIKTALENTRQIDDNLVKAQETRRIIDRLFGYEVSPLLWKKIAPKLSAGRVQSVAMRLLVERERERIRFRGAEYWDLTADFEGPKKGDAFRADLWTVDGKRVASGKDFDPATGALSSPGSVVLLREADALALRSEITGLPADVSSVDEKPFTARPSPPFTTSTLQQEGSRKLGFSAKRTMQVAQLLYENGFITYMRTDSTTLSDQAIEGARSLIRAEFGPEYVPDAPRIYKTKVKNAQEAHEAVRPAGEQFAPPAAVREKLGHEALRLYELVWKRTIACQMKDATGTRVTVGVDVGRAGFRASGRTISFPGFFRAYVEGSDDPASDMADREKVLPRTVPGDRLTLAAAEAARHETQPPARFTEGSLIKELERLGIGRPSTWATIVDVILSRSYCFKRGTALVPSFLAMAVTGLLERYLDKVIDYEFTARLEEDLDAISRGEKSNLPYLEAFYRGDSPGLLDLVKSGQQIIDPRDVCGIPLGVSSSGRPMEVRIGKFGNFLTDGESKASLTDSLAPDELTTEAAEKLLGDAKRGPESIGTHPVSGSPVYVKSGRFGPYVQEGDPAPDGTKPKMASLLPGMKPEEVGLDTAVALLSLPRVVGRDPGTGEDVVAANGRFGPYVKRGSDTRTLPADLSVLTVTLAEALDVLARPKTRGRQTTPVADLKTLGNHPDTGNPIVIRSGRYGPYVTDGVVNASLPRGADPAACSIDQAVTLLAERAQKLADGGGAPARGKRGGAKAKAASAPAKTPKEKTGAAKSATTKSSRGTKRVAAE